MDYALTPLIEYGPELVSGSVRDYYFGGKDSYQVEDEFPVTAAPTERRTVLHIIVGHSHRNYSPGK